MKKIIVLLLVLIMAISLAQTGDYKSNTAHTHVLFKAKHLGVAYTFGRFNEHEGSLYYDNMDPTDSQIEFNILTESVDTNNEKRDGHLRSPDFFDAANFPAISFKSDSIAKTDTENNYLVSGKLSMHGVTKEITIPVEFTGSGKTPQGQDVIGFYTEFKLDRSDYGMSNLLGATGGGELLIIFSFEGTK